MPSAQANIVYCSTFRIRLITRYYLYTLRVYAKLTISQDSDTNPNTTASSVAGDAPGDGRKRRTEVYNMRKSIYGKKHDKLGASKVRITGVI